MRIAIYTLVFGVLVLGVPPLQSQTKQSGTVNKLMVEKLKNAKTLLEGIAVADFNKITRSAEELIQLSKTAEWHVLKTPRYEMFSNEFRRAADVIIQKAKVKNIDGVTLSYFEMVMSCVRCHQYVREVREARLPTPLDVARR
ncbi:MAG TPA: hypothetical protein VEL76_31535 [Gemmataceae bacterium]|nr:hypothetical protein [Gemmataceae bacterium]